MFLWIKDGNTLYLDRKPFILMAHDGLGMVDTKRIEDSAPLQHGTTDRGFKLPARDIVLYIELFADNWEHYYDLRDELLRYFTLSGGKGTLRQIEGSRIRDIEGYAISGLGFTDSNRQFQRHVVPIVLHCPNPLWKQANSTITVIQGGGSTGIGEVPTEVPFTVGTSTFSANRNINYNGSFDAYPEEIRINGAITNPVITNSNTGAKIEFPDTEIAMGDYYVIKLGHGKNTVKDSSGNNKIAELSDDSDLTGFVLSAMNSNSIEVYGTSITAETSVEVYWREYYIGI